MAGGPKDSGKLTINLGSFEGGQSVDFKNGVANSFLTSGASAVLVDLPVEMVQDPTGTRWILGDAGNLYKLTIGGTLTKVSTLTDGNGYGMVYNQLSDMLYITGQQTVSMYGPLQGTPALKDMQFGKSASNANGVVNLYQTTTTNWDGAARNNIQSISTTQGVTATSQVTSNEVAAYTVPSTIDETAATNKCPFAPDIEPFYSIAVYVTTIGTGNMILTLHDGFNRALATVTILHASIAVGYNEFVFTAPGVRSFTGAIQSGLSAAYHFHITSSVGSDTMAVGTITASDLSTVDFILFNYRMVKTNNGWHPATIFTGNGFMLCIGNGQYLSTYNFSNDQNPSNNVWQRERFPIDAGFEICGLSVNNQYLVIAAEKRSSSSVNNYQEGFIYLWDGQNATYNFKIAIPMGAPYSIYTFNNITYFVAAGALYAFGGNPGQSVIKIRPIAYQNTDYLGTTDLTIVNPNMMAPRFNILMIGYPSKTTNVNLKYGVYTWGSVELIYPNSFGYGYALSNGVYNYSAANNLQIGMIKNFVDTMYIASRKTVSGTTTYYLDFINNSSTPAANFNWASLIYDGGVRYKQKEAMRLKVSFLPWPANATLDVWYALERGSQVAADPITSASYSPSTGDTSIIIDINKRFYEAQWGFTGTCSSPALPPTITGVTMEIDPLGTEADLRADDQAEGS
jgi:hypothetical protein